MFPMISLPRSPTIAEYDAIGNSPANNFHTAPFKVFSSAAQASGKNCSSPPG
jgi:hypothetical protein